VKTEENVESARRREDKTQVRTEGNIDDEGEQEVEGNSTQRCSTLQRCIKAQRNTSWCCTLQPIATQLRAQRDKARQNAVKRDTTLRTTRKSTTHRLTHDTTMTGKTLRSTTQQNDTTLRSTTQYCKSSCKTEWEVATECCEAQHNETKHKTTRQSIGKPCNEKGSGAKLHKPKRSNANRYEAAQNAATQCKRLRSGAKCCEAKKRTPLRSNATLTAAAKQRAPLRNITAKQARGREGKRESYDVKQCSTLQNNANRC
jgi:hypothetical protein